MEKTRIGIIGLGGIAQLVHLPNFSKMSNVIVSAVSEINKNRHDTIADKFNIAERYVDYNEMLENSNVEAVVIATPTNTHKEVAIAALKSKKDILVEKPLARTYAERSEEHTSELQSRENLVCRLLLEKKKKIQK